MTFEAEKLLQQRTNNPVLIIPDLLANGGFLVASTFEIYKDQTRQGNPLESVEVY